jgi:hypothetical protein
MLLHMCYTEGRCCCTGATRRGDAAAQVLHGGEMLLHRCYRRGDAAAQVLHGGEMLLHRCDTQRRCCCTSATRRREVLRVANRSMRIYAPIGYRHGENTSLSKRHPPGLLAVQVRGSDAHVAKDRTKGLELLFYIFRIVTVSGVSDPIVDHGEGIVAAVTVTTTADAVVLDSTDLLRHGGVKR